jgi:hypothetical protein
MTRVTLVFAIAAVALVSPANAETLKCTSMCCPLEITPDDKPVDIEPERVSSYLNGKLDVDWPARTLIDHKPEAPKGD